MIEVSGLRKTYGDFAAVVGSSFEIERGEIFGVVGPNGAGKTTTLKMLAGLIEPTAGTATVAGFDAGDPEMRHQLGFLPEESPLYEDMTARSYLKFFADLYDVPREAASDRIESTLDRLELEYRDRRLGDVSKGMKRKVAIARSLVNDPDVLIYDEPASGLDPLTTNSVLDFTEELREDDKTVIFSAHNLYHVESVCDRVVIMNEGRIIARGSVAEIREEHGETSYNVYTDTPLAATEPTADGRHRAVVETMDAVESIQEAASAAGGTVEDIRTDEPSLESIFLRLTGQQMPGRRTAAATEASDESAAADGDDAAVEATTTADTDADTATESTSQPEGRE